MGGGGGAKVKETADEQELARISAEQWNLYQTHYVPLEELFKEKVFNIRSPAGYADARSVSQAAYSDEFTPEMNRYQGGLIERGVNPDAGQFKSPALEKAFAASKGRGMADAQIQNTNRFYRGLEGILAMGRGQSGGATEGMQDVAQTAVQNAASAAKRRSDQTDAYSEIPGMAAGAAVGYGMTREDPKNG